MKIKIFLVFLFTAFFLAGPIFSQEVFYDKNNSSGKALKKKVASFEDNINGFGQYPVAQMPKIYFTAKKTMNATAWGDTIFTVSTIGIYKTIRWWIQDSSGNSKTDSFKVYTKDTTASHAGAEWVQIPCKNITIAAQTAGLDVVPGDGKLAIFECLVEYGQEYRIVRVNSSYAARTKSFITCELIRP